MNNYHDKYLKYKMKYLALKDKMKGSGSKTPDRKKRKVSLLITAIASLVSS